jgi:hypothetical protein
MSSTDNTEEKKNENNIGDFAKDVVSALIKVLILGILGANFVFLTRLDLDMLFPTDIEKRPYTDKNKAGNELPELCPGKKPMNGGRKIKQKGGSKGTGCGDFIDICDSKLFENNYFKNMFDYGFPYTLESKEETFGGIIENWFVNKVKYSYVWLRTVLNMIISFSSSFCAMVPDKAKDIVPFIIGPMAIFLLLGISSIWYIPSLISVFWNENQKWKGFGISFVGLFFGWTWIVPLFTSFVQMFCLMFKLILLPIMLNAKTIINIMGNEWNTFYLKLIFFIFCIISAFKNLNLYVAIAMSIVFLINMLPPKVAKAGNALVPLNMDRTQTNK